MPEFGPDGEDPPLAGQWQLAGWELFTGGVAESTQGGDWALARLLMEPHAQLLGELKAELAVRKNFTGFRDFRTDLWKQFIAGSSPLSGLSFDDVMALDEGTLPENLDTIAVASFRLWEVDRELRRLIHRQRWKRVDPLIRLPPGSSTTFERRVKAGLAIQRAESFARSLGFEAGTGLPQVQATLSSRLAWQTELKTMVQSEEERSLQLSVTNSETEHDKKFAVWGVQHEVRVEALGTIRPTAVQTLKWWPRDTEEFLSIDSVVVVAATVTSP